VGKKGQVDSGALKADGIFLLLRERRSTVGKGSKQPDRREDARWGQRKRKDFGKGVQMVKEYTKKREL